MGEPLLFGRMRRFAGLGCLSRLPAAGQNPVVCLTLGKPLAVARWPCGCGDPDRDPFRRAAIVAINSYGLSGRESNLERGLIYLAVVLLSAIGGWALAFCPGRKSADTMLSTLTEGACSVLGMSAWW